MKERITPPWFLSLSCLLLAFCLVSTSWAEDFYKNKTIRYIISSTPGGGYDTYARLLARHLSKHTSSARWFYT